MKNSAQKKTSNNLYQEWRNRLAIGETVPQILSRAKSKTEKKIMAMFLAEYLKENPLFKDDDFFIDPAGEPMIMSIESKELSKDKQIALKELGFKKKEKGEEETLPQTWFEEVKKLSYLPVDPEFYDILPHITPYRLKEDNLEQKQILNDGSIALKYKIQSRGKTVIFNFLIPPEVFGKIEDKAIPTVGVNMRKSLFGTLAFAFQQNTFSPTFKRSQLLQLIGEDPQKKSKLYSDLDKGLLTWAYATYTIIAGNKILEVGHIVNRVKIAEKKGGKTSVEFNPNVVKPFLKSEINRRRERYIAYPMSLLKIKNREMKFYVRNFLDSLIKKQGMGRQVYPKYVDNILIQDFGISSKKLRKLSHKQIHDIFFEAIDEARKKHLIFEYKIMEDSKKKALYNVRKWKIKFIVTPKF